MLCTTFIGKRLRMLQNNVIIRKNLTPRAGKRPENVIFFTCAIDPRIDILSSIYDNGSNYTCVDINNPEYRLLRCFLKCSKILRKMGVSLNRLGAKTDASRLHFSTYISFSCPNLSGPLLCGLVRRLKPPSRHSRRQLL